MTYYAYYDTTEPAPQQVKGWYDDSFHAPEHLPPHDKLVVVTSEQWAARLSNPSAWGISNGALVPWTKPPPVLTLAEQAAATLHAGGVEIVSMSTPTLNGTYDCSPTTNNQDGNLLASISHGLVLPGGVITRHDLSGKPHTFTTVQFVNFCHVKIMFAMALNAVMLGNDTELPIQPVTIP